jgi:hypothetical protein
MIEAQVINMLLRWARWKMNTGNALGYPGQVSFMRLVPPATHFPDPGLESECIMTQKAYELLPLIHQSVLWVEFLSTKINYMDKAHYFGGSPRRYVRCLNEAYKMLGNHLDLLYQKREEVA